MHVAFLKVARALMRIRLVLDRKTRFDLCSGVGGAEIGVAEYERNCRSKPSRG